MLDRWLNNKCETIKSTEQIDAIPPEKPWILQPEYKENQNPYNVILFFKDDLEHKQFKKHMDNNKEKLFEALGKEYENFYANPKYIEYLCKTGKCLNVYLEKWRKERS